MLGKVRYLTLLPVYIFVLAVVLLAAFTANRAITTITEETPVKNRTCVVIDPGHGGIDGGAVSCTGFYESHINLEISMRLDDLLHLLGIHTVMTRKSDISIHTAGESIAAKKVSDLKQRVNIVNTTQNAMLISIHQNYFSDSRYAGAQVFYAGTQHSEKLAKQMQTSLKSVLNPTSKRLAKKADGIYLLQNINCPGILVECGFLSNPVEEAKLRDKTYQNKICCVIASTVSQYLNSSIIA